MKMPTDVPDGRMLTTFPQQGRERVVHTAHASASRAVVIGLIHRVRAVLLCIAKRNHSRCIFLLFLGRRRSMMILERLFASLRLGIVPVAVVGSIHEELWVVHVRRARIGLVQGFPPWFVGIIKQYRLPSFILAQMVDIFV